MSFRFFTINPIPHFHLLHTSCSAHSYFATWKRSRIELSISAANNNKLYSRSSKLFVFISIFVLFHSLNQSPTTLLRSNEWVFAESIASERMWNRKSICCEKNKSTLYGCIEQHTFVVAVVCSILVSFNSTNFIHFSFAERRSRRKRWCVCLFLYTLHIQYELFPAHLRGMCVRLWEDF